MSFGLSIATEAQTENASRMLVHGEDYIAAVQRLTERGCGGDLWGDDGLFGTIRATYAECTQTGVQALSHLGGGISATGEGVAATVVNIRAAEDVNVQNAARLHGGTWV
ncbi:hypothetical protein AB0B45_08540 [Nonomuraea sp. NPDC049152]|uniref:hypothetical protein n=1 Tax=Nonomuraea sp. NPDC049152 TaxID=3154350 RepID=UPI0033F3ECEF